MVRGRRRAGRGHPDPPAPPLRGGWLREENGWAVRSVSGAAASKPYRCPGCAQEIGVGVPHVVVWPADSPEGTAERRHWHTACWQRAR